MKLANLLIIVILTINVVWSYTDTYTENFNDNSCDEYLKTTGNAGCNFDCTSSNLQITPMYTEECSGGSGGINTNAFFSLPIKMEAVVIENDHYVILGLDKDTEFKEQVSLQEYPPQFAVFHNLAGYVSIADNGIEMEICPYTFPQTPYTVSVTINTNNQMVAYVNEQPICEYSFSDLEGYNKLFLYLGGPSSPGNVIVDNVSINYGEEPNNEIPEFSVVTTTLVLGGIVYFVNKRRL